MDSQLNAALDKELTMRGLLRSLAATVAGTWGAYECLSIQPPLMMGMLCCGLVAFVGLAGLLGGLVGLFARK